MGKFVGFCMKNYFFAPSPKMIIFDRFGTGAQTLHISEIIRTLLIIVKINKVDKYKWVDIKFDMKVDYHYLLWELFHHVTFMK